MLKFSTFEELLENEGLKKKAAKSGISYGTLKKVYNRGMAAWKTGHRPGTTPQQWGMARVNSYIGKGKGTYYGADSDLSGKGKKKSKKESVNESFSYHNDMAKAHKSHAMRHNSEFHHGNHNYDDEDMHGRAIDIHKQAHAAHIKARNLSSYDSKGEYKKAAKDAHSLSQTAIGTTKDAGKFKTGQPKHKFPKLKLHTKSESTVKEISKNLATKYIGKASRDMYHKGQQQGTADAISRLGGPDQDYKKSPERKAAMRVRGIDRATKRLAKREATIVDPNDLKGRPKKADPNPESKFGIKHPMHPANMAKSKMMPKRMKEAMSDAEKAAHQKAIDAFKAKGGKIKKLKPGFAQGYHGKADPGAGMKGMISPADTKQFGTKKKVGSMK